MPGRQALGGVPHHDLDLVDGTGLDRECPLVTLAVAQPDEPVAEALREAVGVDVEELGGYVGVGGRRLHVRDQPHRPDQVQRFGQRLAGVDEHVYRVSTPA